MPEDLPHPPRVPSRLARIAAVAAVFVAVFVVRWVTLTSLDGEDHGSLWMATALLKGDVPLRDIADLGSPLQYSVSAIAQALAGHRVVGEVLLGTLLVASAFTIAFHLAWQASGSRALAAGLTMLGLLATTERGLYPYPKTFLYPLGLWLAWRYIDRPSTARAVVLALGIAVAFGYRHDHGAYIGVGAATALLIAHWREGMRGVVTACLRVGVALLLFLAPYLILVQAHEGIVQYFVDRLDAFHAMDTDSRRTVRFTADARQPATWISVDPPRPARVFVEWKPEIATATRLALEQKYSLANGVDPKKGLYEYLITDVSRENLSALVGDSRIVDRSGISVSYRENAAGAKSIEDVVVGEGVPSDAPAAARGQVELQWNRSVDDAERATLERRYGLLDYRSKWEYALTNVGTDNIRAIVDDAAVADTGLIDRDSYRPMEEPWSVRVQRAIPLLRISIAPRYWHRENAGAALHYLTFAMPFILLLMLAARRMRGVSGVALTNGPEKMLAAAVMMAVAYLALLRRDGYFADHAAATAILAACVLGQALGTIRAGSARTARIGSALLAALVLIVFVFGSLTYARTLDSLADLPGVWRTSVDSFERYSTSPPIDEYAPKGTTGDRGLIRYIYECTRPDDRVWILTDLYTFPYYSERRFVDHIYWNYGLLHRPEAQRRTIAQVDREEVPIILGLGGADPLRSLASYPLVRDYVARRYLNHYAIPDEKLGRDQVFWLLTDSRRKPSGTYELLGLPCFK